LSSGYGHELLAKRQIRDIDMQLLSGTNQLDKDSTDRNCAKSHQTRCLG
jgi:hypothetical protein